MSFVIIFYPIILKKGSVIKFLKFMKLKKYTAEDTILVFILPHIIKKE